MLKKELNQLKFYQKKVFIDAISRAYYAFFDAANALLITKGLVAKTHAGVITLFSLHFIKSKLIPLKYIRFFRQAKDAREQADYEILKKFSKLEAKQIIQTAQDFVDFVNKNF